MPKIVVAGLGPAGPELVTTAVHQAVQRIPRRYLRTARHPSASAVPDAATFDHLYDTLPSFETVYRAMVDSLTEAAIAHDEILYAVPGSPMVAERSVELLLAQTAVEVEILAGPSFLDLVWATLGIDPIKAGVRLVDGANFAVDAAGQGGPLLVAQCWSRQVLSDIKLSAEGNERDLVTVLCRLGLPDQATFEVGWPDLDKVVEPDHLTTLWIPRLASPVGAELGRLAELVRTLRQRCPWDRQQTHASLSRHLLEESYEVLEAIEGLSADSNEPGPSAPGAAAYAHLEEELGDLLFQIELHALLAAEAGQFDLADVARGVHDKLVHRHPHVFGDVQASTAEAVMADWEQRKQLEKDRASLMEGIPAALPSLIHAHKVQRKAASVGFEPFALALGAAKPAQHLGELEGAAGGTERVERDRASEVRLGELLFAVVDMARRLGLDPEAGLRRVSLAFRDRFMAAEVLASRRGVDLAGLDEAGRRRIWADAGARLSDGGPTR